MRPICGGMALLACLSSGIQAQEPGDLQIHYRAASVEHMNGWVSLPVFVTIANNGYESVQDLRALALLAKEVPPVEVYVDELSPQSEYNDVYRIDVPVRSDLEMESTGFEASTLPWVLSYVTAEGEYVEQQLIGHSMDVPAKEVPEKGRGN